MMRIVTLLCFSALFLHAQEQEVVFSQAAEDFFLLGMRQYAQKDFRPALQSFRSSAESAPLNHRITAALVMQAKSLYALRSYAESAVECDTVLARFPATSYREDLLFTKGMCLYNLNDYPGAMDLMLQTYAIAQERLNREHSLRVMENVASDYLPLEQVERLVSDTLQPEVKNILTVVLAERYVQVGRTDDAKQRIAQTDRTVLDPAVLQRLNRVISQLERGNAVRIGVLLPLLQNSAADSREKKVAGEVLEGIRLAVSDHEEQAVPGHVAIELDVQDSQKDSVVITGIMEQWRSSGSVTGIVGPIFSGETMTAARLAQSAGIPLITPTATDEGIAGTGPFIFQANSTNGARGKTLARYAVNVLGAKEIAILGSSMSGSLVQADSFIAEAKRLGASIVYDKRYAKGETDLRSTIRALRTAAAHLNPDYLLSLKGRPNIGEITRKLTSVGVKFSVIDSVMASGGSFNFTPYFGARAKIVADSLGIPVKKTAVYVDSLSMPISTIDVIFCPIANSHEIGILTSQLAFYNLRSIILGSSEWNDANELDLNKRYANGVLIGADRWIDRDERSARVFAKYSQKYGRPVSDNVLFGYDVMSMLIAQFRDGALTREQLATALTNAEWTDGIRNGIDLVPDRVNSALSILQYKSGVVTKVQSASSR